MLTLNQAGRLAEMIADLRVQMDERDLTFEDVAESCDVDSHTAQSILDGEQIPTIDQLINLASAIGCRWSLVSVS